MTGRAAGHCAGNPAPGYATPAFGRGRGGGRGAWGPFAGLMAGRRRRSRATGVHRRARAHWGLPTRGGHLYSVAPTRAEELSALQSEARYLEDALTDIKKRVEELEADKNQA
jgi:hypothetical protein